MVILLDGLSVLVEFVRLRYPAHTNEEHLRHLFVIIISILQQKSCEKAF